MLALAEGRDSYAQVLIRTGEGKASPDNDIGARRLGQVAVSTINDLEAADAVELGNKRPDVIHDVVLEGPGDRILAADMTGGFLGTQPPATAT